MEQMTITFPGLEDLMKEIQSLKMEVKLLSECMNARKTVTISDIAAMEGISKSSLYGTERYLLPRFGESAYPDGTTRWDTEEYFKWREVPVSERKQMYQSHIRNEQKRLCEKRSPR